MFVIPNGEVRDPSSGEVLPAEGKEVVENSFWLRRLRDGSVRLAPESHTVVVKNVVADFPDYSGGDDSEELS